MALLLAVAFAGAGFTVGCGPDTGGRMKLSGKVNFRGAPLKTGAIEFKSKDGKSQSGAPITDGMYSIPAPQGLAPGEYTVRISSMEAKGAAPGGPPGPESMNATATETIPAEYNTNTKLTATIPQGGSDKVDFDLK